MKKIYITMLLLSMTFCFAACGGSENDETPTSAVDATTDTAETDTTEANTTVADAATDDQALADADYNQLFTFVESLSNHTAMIDQLNVYREQYDGGDLTVEDLIAAYQQISDDSQLIFGQLQSSTWGSDAYNDQINLLTETLEALAQAETLNTEALTNNDEDKLIEADTYMSIYNEKFDEFLTAMGV